MPVFVCACFRVQYLCAGWTGFSPQTPQKNWTADATGQWTMHVATSQHDWNEPGFSPQTPQKNWTADAAGQWTMHVEISQHDWNEPLVPTPAQNWLPGSWEAILNFALSSLCWIPDHHWPNTWPSLANTLPSLTKYLTIILWSWIVRHSLTLWVSIDSWWLQQ